MPFVAWLKKQKERNDSIGDLARDFYDDSCCLKVKTPDELRSHINLKHSGACQGALEALDRAKAEWELLV